MSIEFLDFIFPFFVFAYGALVTFTLNHPTLIRLSATRLPQNVHQQLLAHRVLALICLGVGTIWSMQNLWL